LHYEELHKKETEEIPSGKTPWHPIQVWKNKRGMEHCLRPEERQSAHMDQPPSTDISQTIKRTINTEQQPDLQAKIGNFQLGQTPQSQITLTSKKRQSKKVSHTCMSNEIWQPQVLYDNWTVHHMDAYYLAIPQVAMEWIVDPG
jgi:hypothetical protein